MINPLCEKTRSTGADDAGTQNTYSYNGFSCGNLAHTVFLEFWVREFADVVNELLSSAGMRRWDGAPDL